MPVIRRVCTLLIVVLMLGGAAWVPTAAAQDDAICVPTAVSAAAEPDRTVEPADASSSGSSAATADAPAAIECLPPAPDYPGPITNIPAIAAGPFFAPFGLGMPETPDHGDLPAESQEVDAPAQGSPRASVSTDTATSSSSADDLAHSGSETFVLAYLGTGLLAFGAFALGLRRATHRR